MTAPSHTTTTTTTTPPTLTASQARALLCTLLSTTPPVNANANTAPPPPRRTTTPTTSSSSSTKSSQQARPASQARQHNITIDASTRIMGHCNKVQLRSVIAPTDQAVRIEELVRGVCAAKGIGEQSSKGNVNVNVKVTVQAGVSVVGSKNAVVVNGVAESGAEQGKLDERKMDGVGSLASAKRRAESEPADLQRFCEKKVKLQSEA